MKQFIPVLAIILLVLLAGCNETKYVCTDDSVVDSPELCPFEPDEPVTPEDPVEEDYTQLSLQLQALLDEEAELFEAVSKLAVESINPEITKSESLELMRLSIIESRKQVVFYENFELFVDAEEERLEKAGQNPAQLRQDMAEEKQNLKDFLVNTKLMIYAYNDDQPLNVASQIELVQEINSQITSLGFEVEEDYIDLLAEYQVFLDKKTVLLTTEIQVIDLEVPGQSIGEKVAVIRAYSDNVAGTILLYSEWETFVVINRVDLEAAGKNTAALDSFFLRERERILGNLQRARPVVVSYVADNPGDFDLINLQNRITSQIAELESAIASY